MKETYETQLKAILNSTSTIDNFYDELDSIYATLYPDDNPFIEYISLAHYKLEMKKLTDQIGIILNDFQEKERANYQFPFFYGLVTGTYFIKMVRDKYSSKSKRNSSQSFFELFLKGKLDLISNTDLLEFHDILTKVLSVGLYSKSFNIIYRDIEFSSDKEFFGIIDPKNVPNCDQLYFIENNINFISSSYSTTLKSCIPGKL